MIQRFLILFLVAAVIYTLWVFRSPNPVPGTVSTVQVQESPKSQDITATQNIQAIIAPASSPVADPGHVIPYSKKPEGNRIEFDVIDGLAVAYGDVLLGKPEAGFQGTHAAYEAPTPRLWDRPEIPYLINPSLPNPKRVEDALEYFHQHTPVHFIPYSGQRDAVVFEPGTENCLSGLGRAGGLQPIKLAPGCGPQEIMHEIMHALGFVHEQSRPDRDSYLEIIWQNIDPKYQSQFAIVPETFVEAMRGSPFDYHSIMMYDPSTFAARESVSTMRSLGAEAVSPVRSGLSEWDIKRLKRLFSFTE